MSVRPTDIALLLLSVFFILALAIGVWWINRR